MKYQRFADIKEFGSFLKINDIFQVMVVAKVDEPPGEIPIRYFFVQATGGRSGLDYIACYRENVGKAIYHEEEQLRELHKKALEVASRVKKDLQKRDLEVLEGEWFFRNKEN